MINDTKCGDYSVKIDFSNACNAKVTLEAMVHSFDVKGCPVYKNVSAKFEFFVNISRIIA